MQEGQQTTLEASNILKPELARGTISCIGATTINEYTNTIKKDTALDRRFERVIIREPSRFQMEEILPTIISYYENFHSITYTDEFLENIIDYCENTSLINSTQIKPLISLITAEHRLK